MKRIAIFTVAAVLALSGWIVVGIADDADSLKMSSTKKDVRKAAFVKNRKFGFEFTGLSEMQLHFSSNANSESASQIFVAVPVKLTHPSATTWKLTNIPGHLKDILYLRFTVHSSHPYTNGIPPQGAINIDISNEDINQASNNNPVTKVLYLPHSSEQKLAASDLETLVSTRLDSGLDAATEAKRRGTILAQVTLSKKNSNNFRPFEGAILVSGGRNNSDMGIAERVVLDERLLANAEKTPLQRIQERLRKIEHLNSASRESLESSREVLAEKPKLRTVAPTIMSMREMKEILDQLERTLAHLRTEEQKQNPSSLFKALQNLRNRLSIHLSKLQYIGIDDKDRPLEIGHEMKEILKEWEEKTAEIEHMSQQIQQIQQAEAETAKPKYGWFLDKNMRQRLEMIPRHLELVYKKLNAEEQKLEAERKRLKSEEVERTLQWEQKRREFERREFEHRIDQFDRQKQIFDRLQQRQMNEQLEGHGSPEERETVERIEHLRRAAENLHAAEQHEAAEKIERQAQELQRKYEEEQRRRLLDQKERRSHQNPRQEVRELLHDLRREVKELRGEVREMHRLLEKQLKEKNAADAEEEVKNGIEVKPSEGNLTKAGQLNGEVVSFGPVKLDDKHFYNLMNSQSYDDAVEYAENFQKSDLSAKLANMLWQARFAQQVSRNKKKREPAT